MIRFVDLRYQGVQARFAFWDTVADEFLRFNDEEAWSTAGDLHEDCRVARSENALQMRLLRLCPPWVFEPPTEEELGFLDSAGYFSGNCPTCGQTCHGCALKGEGPGEMKPRPSDSAGAARAIGGDESHDS